MTDEERMTACGRGSQAAFGELFHAYRQPIWAFFRRRVVDSARAEELAQEVFVALWQAAGRYEPRAPFRAYLFGIAYRVLGADRRRERSESAIRAHDLQATRTVGADAEWLWVRDALTRLDEPDREVLMLREFEQLSYSEIAGVLQLPINTVRSRLFRARGALRQLLTPGQTIESGSVDR
jgi:RNA polymerase sigma-70 factor (ECF subfamily)